MLARRLAAATGLLMALAASQLPEFMQQYRQRLGGAIDELQSIVANFDAEAAQQRLDRRAAIARLNANGDALAQAHGHDMQETANRLMRLEDQSRAFAQAGPASQFVVMFEDFDAKVAAGAYAAYQPAVPVTTAGFLTGLFGLVTGWSLTHAVAWPLRRRLQTPHRQRA